jgi:hypothetical protein
LADARQFGGVHGYLPRADNHAKIVDFLSIKGTFFGFQEKGFFMNDFKDMVGSFLVFFKGF